MRRVLLGLALALCICSALAQNSSLPTGTVIPKVVCASAPDQSYALYLPSHYSPAKNWPIIYAFDPGARGKVAVEAIREAAEQYGYIVAASNNSRNGSWTSSAEAANAVASDTHQRLSIDDRRVYTAGFSGGARVATQIALMCGTCVAGVIGNGAGFPLSASPKPDQHFAYFLAVGKADFNYPEMTELRHQLEQVHARYRIHVFNGGHEWSPPDAWKEALRWMDLEAMSSGAIPQEIAFRQEIFRDDAERARSLESSGDVLEAVREYQFIFRDYSGLPELASLKSHAQELRSGKQFKSAERDERASIEQQSKLAQRTSSQMQGIANNEIELSEFAEIRRTILDLKQQTDKAKDANSSDMLVRRRALGELVVQAYEAGEASMEKKDYRAALQYFDLVAAGAKSPAGAHYLRARAYAGQGDAKRALEELKQADAAGYHDATSLDAPEFAAIRQQRDFQSLVAEWSKQAQP